MHGRVAIDFAGRGLKDFRPRALGETQHVDRAVHAGLQCLHGIILIMDRRGRAGEIVDLVDLHIEREGHVVPHHLEARLAQQMLDVAAAAGEIVVDAQHFMAGRDQQVAQVRADETGSAADKYPV
jgi:hypothetical protein